MNIRCGCLRQNRLWTGEEPGLIGSRYWIEHPADGASLERVVVYFNRDMVGIGRRGSGNLDVLAGGPPPFPGR